MLVVFNTTRRSTSITRENTEILMNCVKDNSTYDIIVSKDETYLCKGCPEEMTNEIKDIINFKDLDISVRNIGNYFENKNGTCE